jgi:RHS repeat-associated protein
VRLPTRVPHAGLSRFCQITFLRPPCTTTPVTGSLGTPLFSHQDHLGSTSVLTNSTGNPIEYLQYFADSDVWIDRGIQQPENGYKFSGKFLDPETGLYDFGARFYDPKTNLWLGIDPAFSENPQAGLGNSMILSTYSTLLSGWPCL